MVGSLDVLGLAVELLLSSAVPPSQARQHGHLNFKRGSGKAAG